MAGIDDVSQRLLREGVAALGLEFSEERAAALFSFLETLQTWAPRLNLVADYAPATLVERHILDSLAAAQVLQQRLPDLETLVDLGSGAGFPGIPLAIFLRPARTILVEPRQRRAHFLRAVARAIPQCPIEVAQCRADALDVAATADAVCSRATFSDLNEFLIVAAPILRAGGLAMAFQGPNSPDSQPQTPAFHPPTRQSYLSPGTDRRFHLTTWTRI
ncbi:MAG: 16S rRNA (guanine(527)-N(7))-methyltransferase RsmG [Deltaproteobacteria bacterium]